MYKYYTQRENAIDVTQITVLCRKVHTLLRRGDM